MFGNSNLPDGCLAEDIDRDYYRKYEPEVEEEEEEEEEGEE